MYASGLTSWCEDALADGGAQLGTLAQQLHRVAAPHDLLGPGHGVPGAAVALDHAEPDADRDVFVDQVDARRAVLLGVPVVHPELGDPAGRPGLVAGDPGLELAADDLRRLALLEGHLDRLLGATGHDRAAAGGVLHGLGPGGHVGHGGHAPGRRPQLVDQDDRAVMLAGLGGPGL